MYLFILEVIIGTFWKTIYTKETRMPSTSLRTTLSSLQKTPQYILGYPMVVYDISVTLILEVVVHVYYDKQFVRIGLTYIPLRQ